MVVLLHCSLLSLFGRQETALIMSSLTVDWCSVITMVTNCKTRYVLLDFKRTATCPFRCWPLSFRRYTRYTTPDQYTGSEARSTDLSLGMAEIVTSLPISSPFIRFAGRWVDDAIRFAAGYNFFIFEAALIPFEFVACNLVIDYWTNSTPTGATIAIIILIYA